MIRRIKYILFFLAIGIPGSFAQVLTNDGAAIFSSSGALIFVDGEILNQGLGTFNNSGTIELTGDWTNNAGNTGFISGSPGNVLMSGGTQNIQGTDPTLFYDLYLTGTGAKTQGINATVTDSLALNDRELAADIYTMFVTNTSTTSVSTNDTTGLVSSLASGGLSWDMNNNTTAYHFPVGSNVGGLRYRPVDILPSVTTPHTYKIRMANVDATTEGYDRTINDSSFCVINPDYYHRIYQTNGASAADVTIYYDDVLDNLYQTITHWQNTPRWEDITPIINTVNGSPTLSTMQKLGWNDYVQPAFALATTSPLVVLSAVDTTICEGDTINLTASSGFANYEFFANSVSVQDSTSNSYQITGLTSGDTIRVTATDVSCTAFSNELIVTVNPVPVIDTLSMVITPDNCGGSTGSIVGITVTGSAPLTYEWLDGTATVVGGDSANVMNLPPEDYILTVTGVNGCTASTDTHNIDGGLSPVVSTTLLVVTQPSCGLANGSIIGIAASGGVGPLTYDWVDISLASVGSALDLNTVGADTYTLTVTDSLGCIATSGPYILTDQPGPQIDTAGFTINQSTCSASDGSIMGINATGGTGPLTYSWVNSVPATVGSTLNLTGVPANSYTLTVTDSLGCTDVSGAHAVSDAGAPIINTTALVIDSSRCDSGTGEIDSLAVTGGTLPLTYSWNSIPAQSNLTATGLIAGNYSLTIIDGSGCIAVFADSVPNFLSAPAPLAASPSAYCTGDPIADLTATGDTGTLIWYSDILLIDSIGTGSPFVSGATSDTSYWVAETRNGCVGPATQVDIVITPTPAAPFAGNDTSICFGAVVLDTINIIGGTGTEWWNNSALDTLLGTGDTLAISPVLGTNIYYVTQSVGTCQGPYDSIIVTLDAPITVTISGNTTICFGDSTTLTASGGSSYVWSTTDSTAAIVVQPTVTTFYNVIATGGACTASAIDTVTVNALPVANITASGTALLCAGETITLTADTAQGYTYSWDTSPISTTVSITVTPPGGSNIIYTLTITNSCGSDSTTLPVAVESILDAGPDLDLCKNTDSIGYGATSSATPIGGTWSSPDPLVFPGNLQSDGFLDHVSLPWTPGGPGYVLVYTSSSGNCTDTLLLDVTGSKAGVDTSICDGTESFFLPVHSPPGGTWTSTDPTANNNIIFGTDEVLTDGLAGDYTFVYTSNSFITGVGCPDSVTVNVCGSNDLWVPNIFSPNGDQINSVMFVRGIAVDWVHIKIYDRWGELVYDSGQGRMALDVGWDGNYNGKELTPQVFVYFLEGAYLDGEVVEMMKGNITLVK